MRSVDVQPGIMPGQRVRHRRWMRRTRIPGGTTVDPASADPGARTEPNPARPATADIPVPRPWPWPARCRSRDRGRCRDRDRGRGQHDVEMRTQAAEPAASSDTMHPNRAGRRVVPGQRGTSAAADPTHTTRLGRHTPASPGSLTPASTRAAAPHHTRGHADRAPPPSAYPMAQHLRRATPSEPPEPAHGASDSRYSFDRRTSAIGPSPSGTPARIVSCSSTHQPSKPTAVSAATIAGRSTSPWPSGT